MEELYVEKRASRGIACGPVYKYLEPDLTPDSYEVEDDKIQEEVEKFHTAREAVKSELEALSAQNEIFAAHLEIAQDFMLQNMVEEKLQQGNRNVQQAAGETVEELAAVFDAMDDAYMKERAADVRDVGKRLLCALKEIPMKDLGQMKEACILVARDLYPSDTVKMNPELVKGILTQEGGITSHVSILAKSMGIPILVGVKEILSKVQEGDLVCMDAASGQIVLQPDQDVLKGFEERKLQYEKEREILKGLRQKPAVTRSGKRISLCVNVGSLGDLRQALEMNIDGVGLFRSEFLYMENTHFPTEEEQFAVYKEAAILSPKELTIRTLDIGGDKELSYISFDKEDNPFLGYRAIRISLDKKEMFKEQIRAILRAGAFGHVRIMFPMIISLEELAQSKALVEECKQELKKEGLPYDENMEAGMMIETPASVLLAKEFAREADFFSIGTNDLTQYILAVDRGNKKIADRYDYFHPAVVEAIRQVIQAGHAEGIKVGMCGEMAGDPKAVPGLLRMGLDEFSMSAGSMDYARKMILEYGEVPEDSRS